ncbi:MAG: EI24 domain-containing protein [Desulfobacterales bacterium]|nr:EI24 domain-containing protein [Desulfobacterales bacterium]
MKIIDGITYNLRGFWMGIKTPKLLILGLIRFFIVAAVTVFFASLIIMYNQEILDLVWSKPESKWIVCLWYILSWLMSLLLVGVSAILSYLVSQILFSVFIMDYMSKVTEEMVTGRVIESDMPIFKQFFFLIKQETPRALIPILLTLILMLIGWLTPLGPVVATISSVIAVIFLAWDNTDLAPARRLEPFKTRFRFLLSTALFHLGFGILFLIPVANIFFLAFAPVGATIYQIDNLKKKQNED